LVVAILTNSKSKILAEILSSMISWILCTYNQLPGQAPLFVGLEKDSSSKYSDRLFIEISRGLLKQLLHIPISRHR